jgi:hypothetical protein
MPEASPESMVAVLVALGGIILLLSRVAASV